MSKLLLMISITILVIPVASWACKQAVPGDEYPVSSLDSYDYIVIARIDKAIHATEYRYKPLVSFEATVIENLKGELDKGSVFHGMPESEEARAVCPVHLVESGIYLLLLTKESNQYFISRFSIYVKNDNKNFINYINQINSALKF